MKLEDFAGDKNGSVVPITTEMGSNWAFVPAPLPNKWELNKSLWRLLNEARDRVARLEQIHGILPDPRLLLRPLQQREAMRSSNLEGTYSSAEELALFEARQNTEKPRLPRNKDESDRLEIVNYSYALKFGNTWLADKKPFNEELILELHRILLTGVRGKEKIAGKFREKQVFVRGGNQYVPPPPEHLTECISQFIQFITSEDDTYDPLVRAFIAHYQFEAIHPFEDGNGRVGRVLLSLCVGRWVNLTLPWLYMSEYYERHRHDYYRLLYKVSTNSEWDEWIEFCLVGAIELSIESIKRCRKLKTLRDDYLDRVGNKNSRMHTIIDQLFSAPILQSRFIMEMCHVARETARSDLHKLEDAGIIEQSPDEHPKTYLATEILEIAYGDEMEGE